MSIQICENHPPYRSLYPIDLSSLPALPYCTNDRSSIPNHNDLTLYHPTLIAQCALASWNTYYSANDELHRNKFLMLANWLLEQATDIGDASGWLVTYHDPHINKDVSCLSALTQGLGISTLVRAYQISHEEIFLELAHRIARTFEQDILDGGVSSPIGRDSIFFEEVAVYPASHALSGFLFALFGLHDYMLLTGTLQFEQLVLRAHTTLHDHLEEYDTGYWIHTDLLTRRLASMSQLALQVALLEVCAEYFSCTHCLKFATRWKSYQDKFGSRLHYLIISHSSRFGHALLRRIQSILFPKPQTTQLMQACVTVPDFPVTGGVLTVLEAIAQVTKDLWQLEFLTHYVGPNPKRFVIHRFGLERTGYWQFPNVWLYVLTGCSKLLSRMRYGANYHVILPQDGVYTAAFSVIAAKLAGVRVVCIDHGHLTLLKSHAYRIERIKNLASKKWHRRLLSRVLYIWYWPSLYLLAWIAAHFIDHYLIPGVRGDGVEEIGLRLGVPPSRITRFESMINLKNHVVLDTVEKAILRSKNNIAEDAIIIAIICRLAPEKGLDIALESINQALTRLSPDLRSRVRVVIAGDGPLHKQLQEEINTRGLSQSISLWGETSRAQVLALLCMSEIFLYTSTRGACFAMAILEAMASGCAVIASTRPISNTHLLADGRGIAVPPDDSQQTSAALVHLLNDIELCHKMGQLARNYIGIHHSPFKFRRTLLRTTQWSGLDALLTNRTKDKTIEEEIESQL